MTAETNQQRLAAFNKINDDFSTWKSSSRPKFKSWFKKDINNNNNSIASMIQLDIDDLLFISFQQNYPFNKRIYLSQKDFENEEFLKLMIYVVGLELANDMYMLSNYDEEYCPDICKLLRHVNSLSQILYFLYEQTQKYQLPDVYKKNLYKFLEDVLTDPPSSIFGRWKIIYDCILMTSLNDHKFTIPPPDNYTNRKSTDIATMNTRCGYLEYNRKFVQHFYSCLDKGNYIKYDHKKMESLRLKLAVGVNKENTPFQDTNEIQENSKIIIQNIIFI